MNDKIVLSVLESFKKRSETGIKKYNTTLERNDLSTLKKCGYTGKIYFIVDNEDKTIEQYQKNYGIENLKIFDKKAMADEVTAAAVVHAAAPVAYTKPRSPINSQATYLEHSVKAKLGSHDSAQYVMAADDFSVLS